MVVVEDRSKRHERFQGPWEADPWRRAWVFATAQESVHGEESNLLLAVNTEDNELRKMKSKKDQLADKRSLEYRLKGHESREDSCP